MYRVLSKNEPLPIQNHNFRETPGIDISWRGGDVIRPLNGKWFGEPSVEGGPKDSNFPTRVVHFFCPWRILPFIRWRFGSTVGYLGFKAFGVDVPEYVNWLPSARVASGSVALTPSARFDADDH